MDIGRFCCKDRIGERKLPYPYYGYDITENMIQGIGQKVEMVGAGGEKYTFWADWIIKKIKK